VQGDLAATLGQYRSSLAARAAFAVAYPTHTDGRHDPDIGYAKIGGVLLLLGDLPAALVHYRQSLPISETFVAVHPTNSRGCMPVEGPSPLSYRKKPDACSRTWKI
jgi:hypothetical protein